jgi:hypothetical protein
MKWKTLENKEIEITELDNGHLINIIRMLRGKYDAYVFMTSIDGRKRTTEEYIQDIKIIYDQPWDYIEPVNEDDENPLVYFALVQEAKKRELNYEANRKGNMVNWIEKDERATYKLQQKYSFGFTDPRGIFSRGQS